MLLIETSTEQGVVAIAKQGTLVFQKNLPSRSKLLLSIISEGLNYAGISMQDIKKIVVGIGPGSYTSIRGGVMVAKTLAYARQLPLIGVSSLECFAIPDENVTSSVMVDAKIGGVYLLKSFKSQQGTSSCAPFLCPLEQLKMQLHNGETIITPNKSRLQPLLQELFPNFTFHWIEQGPCPGRMMQIATNRTANELDLNILYLRQTQAEIEKGKAVSRILSIQSCL